MRKGAGFGGVLRYLYGPGRHEEHSDPHRVGGTAIGDDPRSLAQELRATAALNERVKKPVAHYPLALPEGEWLSDEQWGQAAHVFLERMGYIEAGSDGFGGRDAPYVVVRHGDDHAHVVASRVRHDGRVVRDSFDFERSHQAARAVEDRFGLSRPPERGRDLAQVTRSERESAQRRQVAPERDQLRQALTAARDSCDGTREDFEHRAREGGVLLRANEAKTGKMNGYSASLQGWTDREGEQIWMPTSKVHRQLRWGQLEQDLTSRARDEKGGPRIPPRDDGQRESAAGRALRGARQGEDQERAAAEVSELRRLRGASFPHEARAAEKAPQRESEAARALRQARERERDRGHER